MIADVTPLSLTLSVVFCYLPEMTGNFESFCWLCCAPTGSSSTPKTLVWSHRFWRERYSFSLPAPFLSDPVSSWHEKWHFCHVSDGGRVRALLLLDQKERELQEHREKELPAQRKKPGIFTSQAYTSDSLCIVIESITLFLCQGHRVTCANTANWKISVP